MKTKKNLLLSKGINSLTKGFAVLYFHGFCGFHRYLVSIVVIVGLIREAKVEGR